MVVRLCAFVSLCLLSPANVFPAQFIRAGTPVEVRLSNEVATATSELGDEVSAIIVKSVQAGGATVLPKGSRLTGRVETIQAATSSNEGRVRLVFRGIELRDGRTASTWITNSFTASPPRRGLRYILLMGSGAVAGAFIGGESARVAGILGGMLTGFVIAGNRSTKLADLTLKAGQRIRLELGEDLTIPAR